MLPWLQKKVVIGIELGHSKRYSVFSLLLYCIHMHHIYQIANSWLLIAKFKRRCSLELNWVIQYSHTMKRSSVFSFLQQNNWRIIVTQRHNDTTIQLSLAYLKPSKMNTSIKLRRILKHFPKRNWITNINLKERQPFFSRIFIQTAYFWDTVQGNRRWIGEVIGNHDWIVKGRLEQACDGVCSDVATASCYENTRSWGSHVVGCLVCCTVCSLLCCVLLWPIFRSGREKCLVTLSHIQWPFPFTGGRMNFPI